eukprot:5977062-Prorocentrum_lima.AAC.1
MTSSLVGSEMCIRDRSVTLSTCRDKPEIPNGGSHSSESRNSPRRSTLARSSWLRQVRVSDLGPLWRRRSTELTKWCARRTQADMECRLAEDLI